MDKALHAAVLGLVVNDGNVGRHRVDGFYGKLDNSKRVLREGNHASNMGDTSRKTETSSSQHDGVGWNKGKYRARIAFSNRHVKYIKFLGYFGVEGDKMKGEQEASQRQDKVKEHVERINEELKDVTDRILFIKKVNEAVAAIK